MEHSTSFGPYRLEALLGKGGMGAVYRAYDTRRGRRVALKLLNSDIAQDPNYRERFRRESRLAAQLNSPHVIPIHDFGALADGSLFIDMRLCDGVDLGKLVEVEGPMAPARAVEIVSQLAEALSVAHREGLVHRDVKPANAIVESHFGRDFVYLVDFGIVRALDGGGATSSLSLTSTGALVGTMPYMAPELFGADSPPTPLVDIYALGCLFYEILVGRRPYDANNLAALIHQHLTLNPPPPSTLRRGVPPSLDMVVSKALSKTPTNRWPDADTFGMAARDALHGQTGTGTPPASPRANDWKPASPPRAARHTLAGPRRKQTDELVRNAKSGQGATPGNIAFIAAVVLFTIIVIVIAISSIPTS